MCIVCGPGSVHLLRAIARGSTARSAGSRRFQARAVAPAVVPPLDPASSLGMDGPADTILRGGPILTMDPRSPEAQAVAVRAGRILAVGSEADALARRGRLTRVIDLHGVALLPGFINAHWHMPYTLLCDFLDRPTADAIAAVAPGEWIVAAGTLELPHSDAHPVVLVDAGGAIRAGNALALAEGPLPGHVAGLLGRFIARMALSRDAVLARLARLLADTAASGVTCLRICGLGTLGGPDDLDLFRAAAEGSLPLRLRATLDAALWPEWQSLQLSPGFGDDMARVDTVSAWPPVPDGLRVAIQAGWSATLHVDEVQPALDAFAGVIPDGRLGLEMRSLSDPLQCADILRRGLSLGLNADAPLALPAGLPVSLGLDAAHGASAPLPMVAQAVAGGTPVMDALAAVTAHAAARCGMDRIAGRLTKGAYADFAFLAHDPRRLSADGLTALSCTGTWVSGRETFRQRRATSG